MAYLLVTWFCLPSLLMVMLSLSSMAAGVVATSCTAILLGILAGRRSRISKVYFWIILGSILSAIVAAIFVEQTISTKQIISIASLPLLSLGASSLFNSTFNRSIEEIARDLKTTYIILAIIGISGATFSITPGIYSNLSHPIFPFSEPSHYTLAYSQIAAITFPFVSHRFRVLIISISLLLAFALPNTTMLAVAILLLALAVPAAPFIVILSLAPLLAAGLLFANPDYFSYFSSRLSNDGSENLSRLVYVQGWESLLSAMDFSGGLGIGFQNLGNEPAGSASAAIALLLDTPINRADGSFIFAKLGGEFGLLGVLLGISVIVHAVTSGLVAKHHLRNGVHQHNMLAVAARCSAYIIVIEVLVRGVGYFSPSLILFIYMLPLSRIKLAYRKKQASPPQSKTPHLVKASDTL